MKRLMLPVIATAALLVGVGFAGSSSAAARPSAQSCAAGQTARTITIQVWFHRNGKLAATTRTRPVTVATGRLALKELIAGPNQAETATGMRSGISAGTPFDISLTNGVATVDLPASFYAGGRDAARLRQAQVVFTLTQYPTISKIGFLKDGEATGWPLGRIDYADFLPPIVVTSLAVGQQYKSPVRIAGIAAVYESTVSVRILDASRREIARTFTTAACLKNCFGRYGAYSVAVSYRVTMPQRGTVEVYSESPEDGSQTHTVATPVLLAP